MGVVSSKDENERGRYGTGRWGQIVPKTSSVWSGSDWDVSSVTPKGDPETSPRRVRAGSPEGEVREVGVGTGFGRECRGRVLLEERV